MPRMARLKVPDQSTWYHVTSRVAGFPGWYPFHDDNFRSFFLDTLWKCIHAYCCDLGAYSLLGNHYHLLPRFEAFRKLPLKELERRASLLFRKQQQWPKTKKQWRRFNKRLFDLSSMMKQFNQELATGYNKTFDRRGSLFGDRFKSVILADLQAVTDCMIYIDLNPIRAGLVDRPEQWAFGSYSLRHQGKDQHLISLDELFLGSSTPETIYRCKLYWRGGIDTNPHFSPAIYSATAMLRVHCVGLGRAPRHTLQYVCGALGRPPCSHGPCGPSLRFLVRNAG